MPLLPHLPGSRRSDLATVGHVSQSVQTVGQSFLCDHDQVRARGPELPGERIEADLRRRLASDEWQSGDALPTLVELAEHYQAARGTVARVLRKLAEDGLVVVRPRWGVFKVLATVARLARMALERAVVAVEPRSRSGRKIP